MQAAIPQSIQKLRGLALGKAGLLQPAPHGGPLFLGGAVFLHVLEHRRDVLALLGGVLNGICATAARSSDWPGHRGDTFLGDFIAAGERKCRTTKGEREQDADQDDHWLTLSKASASSFSRL